MGLKADYRIFFAIPFDSATKSLYEYIKEELIKKYQKLTIIIGTEETGPSPKYSDISTFKAQNNDLFCQFISEIQKADILVADLTHNNSNVHVELGFALSMNKNILRVTGRGLTELGFDIRNFEVYQYSKKEKLFKKICEYLDIFFKIKNLTFSDKHPSLYKSFPDEQTLNGMKGEDEKVDKKFLIIYPLPDVHLRDGKIKVQFKFINQITKDDWFGIYLRFDNNPLIASYLVYVRKNGCVEIGEYPGPKVDPKKLQLACEITDEETLLVEIENNLIRATINGNSIDYDKVRYQFQGKVGLACWGSEIVFKNVEVLCQDTIDNIVH